MRFGMTRKSKPKKAVAALTAAVLAALFVFIAVRMHNVFITEARAYGNDVATTAISKAVYKSFENIDSDFSSVHTDENGNSVLDTDTAKVNLINSALTDGLQEQIAGDNLKKIYIPLGAVTGIAVLSGIGPKIPVTINPISVIGTDIKESFESCGINQVRHSIYIAVEIKMAYSGCFLSSTETVNVSVPVADTVIVGNTPQYYGYGKNALEQ